MFEHLFDNGGMDVEGPRWHPQLLAREEPPAHWVMRDARHVVAGTIELRRTEDGPRYRVEHRGTVIGWAATLKVATERLHRAIISEAVPGGGVNGR
ncbi:hypothetical protein DBR36_14485 [Microbacterium sp. HMWF026]|uniref:hypothetical protein n=1 Tax=Microbacterium sp. HMWF026 TaxID=2056861 RepID=UPI000D44BF4F|nr:hypothetical protein [Microbacterium sp. HMWF026]PTT15692.1 hypothetical protein DBR36_14485 [Microbacterium sp. HMWF026]